MKKINKLLIMVAFSIIAAGLFAQGTTTAGLNGKVTDNNGVIISRLPWDYVSMFRCT